MPNANFFEISSVITEAKKKLKKNCEALAVKLYSLQNSLTNDLYSYISRLYLDNSVSGKQINQFFTEIENSTGDVVIHRDSELTWSPYFLYVGLTDKEVFSANPDVLFDDRCIMPNEYYGVDSIQLIYNN